MNNQEIYYPPDIPTVYKPKSNRKRNETNQKYYYKSHLIDYLSQQFSSITKKIGKQQDDVKESLSHQIEHKTIELLRKYQSQVIFQEKVKKEIKDEIHEIVIKLLQLEDAQEQVREKILRNLYDARSYLSDKQSLHYEQISEEIKQYIAYMDISQSEKYKTLHEQFVSNHNEVKAQVIAEGQESRNAINDIDEKLKNVGKEIKNETYELVYKFNQLEEIKEEVSKKHQQDIEHAKTYISNKQSLHYEQLSEDIKQCIDYVNTLQSEKFKKVHELIVKNHNEVQEQLEVQGQMYESSDKKLENVMEAIKSLQKLDNSGTNNPPIFKLGDRIIVYSDGEKTLQSGVFIHETNLCVVWVNDSTNRLNLTNKKGLSIARE